MGGAACVKQIINNGYRAASQSVEETLRDPAVRDVLLPAAKCDELLLVMVEIDRASYLGGKVPEGGLAGVIKTLVSEGVYTEDVWVLYAAPPE